MSKIKPIHYRKLIKVFEHYGFKVRGRKGDHISMVKAGVTRPVIIKCAGKEVPVAHIRTNMTTAGMTREEYFTILGKL